MRDSAFRSPVVLSLVAAILGVALYLVFQEPKPLRVVVSPQATLEHPDGQVKALGLFPDGYRLASSNTQGDVQLWDLALGDQPKPFPSELNCGSYGAMALSPDVRVLATPGPGGVIRLRDASGGGIHRSLENTSASIAQLAFSRDGRFLLALGSNVGALYASDANADPCFSLNASAWSFALSPDGRWLATGKGTGVRLWSFPSGTERGQEQATPEPFRCLAFSPDGKLLATGEQGGGIHLWKVPSGGLKVAIPAPPHSANGPNNPQVLAFQPGGRLLACGSMDGTVRLYDTRTAKLLACLEDLKPNSWVCALAFTPDGQTLLAGGGEPMGGMAGHYPIRRWTIQVIP